VTAPDLFAPRAVRCSWAQSSADLALPADTVCVPAPRYDVLRDGIVRDDAPAGRVWRLGDVPRGSVAWVADGARWRAVEVW
jgi:hypothetical protein